MQVHWQPLTSWPRPRTVQKTRSQFSATFEQTLDLLRTELGNIGCKYVVIQLALSPEDIRNDGWPRSSARVSDPGVLVSFESKHGPLEMACDAFLHWHENLRAVAMTLHRLRMTDLYGCSTRGEQYRGWTQLPAPPPVVSAFPTVEAAAAWLWKATEIGTIQGIVFSKENRATAYRAAAKKFHPDMAGGSTEKFQLLEDAKKVLDVNAPL